jgi:ArsR family transcriptional regulator, arsenate/arsenite/antimonite-responsive transcriptional repressor / arsenate reductase (thioredoxin)
VSRIASPPTGSSSSPPAFLRLAAHPLRWRLLSELAHSDRRVSELCELVTRPHNLVSYHLAQLRAGGLVLSRRSQADGRDAYYVLDLRRCRDLLAESGGELHPGLRLSATPAGDRGRAGRRRRARVLFLCTGNSARSQIAEALTAQLADGSVQAFSAGSDPKPLHPNTVRVMRERGIDASGSRSKAMSGFADRRFDYVVSLCDRVREVCPEFPDHPQLIHWSVPDPARERDTDAESYPAFERTAAELARRIPFLLELIEHDLTSRRYSNADVR